MSDASFELEDILVKTLDVQHGWEKVGRALKIKEIDLQHWKYNKLESPTVLLLETLKASYPDFTVAKLIDTLKGPKVNRPDVVSHIHQHLQRGRK